MFDKLFSIRAKGGVSVQVAWRKVRFIDYPYPGRVREEFYEAEAGDWKLRVNRNTRNGWCSWSAQRRDGVRIEGSTWSLIEAQKAAELAAEKRGWYASPSESAT